MTTENEFTEEQTTDHDPEDVSARLRDAMYEVNDCWEYAETEAGKAHIDDAIHHLKAARAAENDE